MAGSIGVDRVSALQLMKGSLLSPIDTSASNHFEVLSVLIFLRHISDGSHT